jgi:multicomponent Na+:H+ antiporter subunit F
VIEVATTISLGFLTFAGLLAVIKLLRPGSLPDRTVALDTLLVLFSAGLAVLAARTGEDTYLNAMVVAALLGFTGTSLVARYIERRGA